MAWVSCFGTIHAQAGDIVSSQPIPETIEYGAKMHPLLAKFCRKFFAHFYEFYSTLDAAAKLGLGSLTQEEKRELAPILDEITSPRYSADDLVKLWKSSPADVWLTNGEQIRTLFKRTREIIGEMDSKQ
jgi:hypothetical protein